MSSRTARCYSKSKHRDIWVLWVRDVHAGYKCSELDSVCIELAVMVLAHSNVPCSLVQCTVAACITIISKADGLCLTLPDLVELGDGAFTFQDLQDAEFGVLQVLTANKRWDLISQSMKIK